MKSDPATRDNTKYCEFHRDYGHLTDNCIQLRREIEYLIQHRYLRRFISPGNQAQNQNQASTQQPPSRQATTQHQQPLGEIHVILGGFAGGGESSSARKAHLHSIRSADMGEIQAVSKLSRIDTTITFSDSDLEGCQHPHDDPLVIRAIVANTTVHRVLVDNGSSADIIFASAFDKMGIGREKLEPVGTHLRGFSGEKVLPLGSIQLVLTLGEPPCQATTTSRFLIVDAPSAYNMLLGKQGWNFIHNPNTLVARLFKAKYFPHGSYLSYLSSSLGYNPSFVWRSVWSAEEVVNRGIRWRVGDGKSIYVWRDAWVRDFPGFMVGTTPASDLGNLKVSDLLLDAGRG